MAYVALYRKWRPKDFSDLIGQDHISKTLANAIASGKIGHAYLFSGPRGTGKTSTAKIFAKALNCENGPTAQPCNNCTNCQKINEGSSMDVFEIDAASNRGIDEIRDLRETVKFAPVDGRYKVYIIDEVHMLTAEAFNALLKTLEEPPAHVVFILATTEAHKVPATIQSRCQRYDFKRITVEEIQKRLALVAETTGLKAEPEALKVIAIHADGGMRDALSILDQCSAVAGAGVTVESVRQILGLVGHEWIWKLTDALAEKDSAIILSLTGELLAGGKDVKQILAEMTLHMRSVMIYKAAGAMTGVDLYSDREDILKQHAAQFTQVAIVQIIQKLHAAMNEIKWSPQPRISLEVALLSLCYAAPEQPMQEAVVQPMSDGRIAQLEAKLAQLSAAISTLTANTRTVDPGGRSNQAVTAAAAQTVMTSAAENMPLAGAETASPAMPGTGGTADGTAVWEKLLEVLKKQGKMPVHACVKAGEARGMNETQFFIAFKSSFMKARTEREDYRFLLEEILENICGRSLRVICTLETAAEPRKTRAPLPKKTAAKPPAQNDAPAVDYTAMTAEERHTLETAVEVFGDNFVRKEDLK